MRRTAGDPNLPPVLVSARFSFFLFFFLKKKTLRLDYTRAFLAARALVYNPHSLAAASPVLSHATSAGDTAAS
jgi:hypothetical protein